MSVIDNTASILTRRRRFSRTIQDVYYLPIMISDGGIPSLSSSSTLTVRVCACERDGRVRTCHAEAFLSSAGLSTGALIAILLCVVILLGKSPSLLMSYDGDSECTLREPSVQWEEREQESRVGLKTRHAKFGPQNIAAQTSF